MYLLGINGGGTATHCIIGDEHGNIYAEGFGGSSNYHTAGKDAVKNAMSLAINRALSKLNIEISDVTYAVLGIASADNEKDFIVLNSICNEIFADVPFEVLNDCWIGLRAGSEGNWGIVSICDTGHGAMGKTMGGEKVELRNMNFTLGNRGGSVEISEDALYHAFRADEKIGTPTKLQYEIPKVFGYKKMEDIDEIVRNEEVNADQLHRISTVVSQLAKEEDNVCQDILISMGSTIGKTAAGIIKRLQIQKTEVPIVLLGSVFTGDNPLFLDAYIMEIHRVAPRAKIKILDRKPVMGAYELAIDYMKKLGE